MKSIINNKGLTLVEILVALAVLGIILVAFLNIFLSGYTTIFSMGHKTEAMAEAQNFLDEIYETRSKETEEIEAILAGVDFEEKEDYAELVSQPYNNVRVRYSVENKNFDGHQGSLVSIKIFYQRGNRSVTLSTLVP